MAKQHYFYNVMRKTIVQFLDLFNDIIIARYNPDTGTVIKYVKVPLKFAPKTKQWYWTELRENNDVRDIVLPMMAINLDSVDYATDRQVNRNYKVSYSNTVAGGRGAIKQHFNPVPYDYTFSLQIASEYMVDITQIIEQILPFFTPEVYIRITIPELRIEGVDSGTTGSENLELRVIYESSDKQAPVEIDEANYRILIWTLTFKVQGYLFSPVYDAKTIHRIALNYYIGDEKSTNPSEDIDNNIGELGNQSVQDVLSATVFPEEGEEVDDSIKDMYKYERFERDG